MVVTMMTTFPFVASLSFSMAHLVQLPIYETSDIFLIFRHAPDLHKRPLPLCVVSCSFEEERRETSSAGFCWLVIQRGRQ